MLGNGATNIIAPVSTLAIAIASLFGGTLFQAIGHPGKATVVSLAKQVIFYIPAMLILAKVSGLIGILWAGPVAEVLAFFLAAVLVAKELKKMGDTRLEEKA